MHENTPAEKCRLIVFGSLVAALILQGLPFSLVTYTAFTSGGVTRELVDTYSYFNIQENAHYFYIPLLTSVATLLAAAGAVATFAILRRAVPGVIMVLLILAVAAYAIQFRIK